MRIIFGAILLALLTPCYSHALYEYYEGDTSLDITALLGATGWFSKNPSIDNLPDSETLQSLNSGESTSGLLLTGRLIGDYKKGNFSFNFNAAFFYNYFHSGSITSSGAGVERSSILVSSAKNDKNGKSQLEFDHLNVSHSSGRYDLIIGRQPINFATCYYFTPNDFFAPFAATQFYREYKAGVDAARLEVRLGNFSQLTIVNVLGYKKDFSKPEGWSSDIDWNRNSTVAKISTLIADVIDVAFIGGKVNRDTVYGAQLQGDLPFGGMGFRAEGHFRKYNDPAKDDNAEISIQVNKRFQSSLDITAEYFSHGAGEGSVADYALTDETPYMANRYVAIGAGYEFSPLINGSALAIFNLVDDSFIASFYGVYSLGDETEGALNFSVPFGDNPNSSGTQSEFGSYPTTISLELRSYF